MLKEAFVKVAQLAQKHRSIRLNVKIGFIHIESGRLYFVNEITDRAGSTPGSRASYRTAGSRIGAGNKSFDAGANRRMIIGSRQASVRTPMTYGGGASRRSQNRSTAGYGELLNMSNPNP
jgi:hypothetical protein